MWLLLGFAAWLTSVLALVGVLGISRRESRREEAAESASPPISKRSASQARARR